MKKLFLILMIAAVIGPAFSIAQVKQPDYYIYKTPVEIGHRMIDSVNRLIAGLHKEEDVRETIDRSLRKYFDLVIHLRHPFDDRNDQYLDYVIGNPTRTVRSFRTKTGAKGTDELSVFYYSQLKAVLSNTVIILDTLKIGLHQSLGRYAAGPYRLISKDNMSKTNVSTLIIKDTLNVFAASSNAKGRPQAYDFRFEPSKAILSRPIIGFAGSEEMTSLKQFAQLTYDLNRNDPAFNFGDFVAEISEFTRLTIGPVKTENLRDWLHHYIK